MYSCPRSKFSIVYLLPVISLDVTWHHSNLCKYVKVQYLILYDPLKCFLTQIQTFLLYSKWCKKRRTVTSWNHFPTWPWNLHIWWKIISLLFQINRPPISLHLPINLIIQVFCIVIFVWHSKWLWFQWHICLVFLTHVRTVTTIDIKKYCDGLFTEMSTSKLGYADVILAQ